MKRKTKVRIQRILFLVKLFGGTAGFIFLLFRFQALRHLISLFAVACILTAIWQTADEKAEKLRSENDGYSDD